jgi:hypothetical protein
MRELGMQKYTAQTIGKNSRKDFELNNISTLVDTGASKLLA